jgi:hypothetical protein
MAKRFTDTEKWKKPFIRGLQGAYKLLWLYICDDCDHAGIWQVDMEVAAIRIGEKIDIKEAIKSFDEKIIIIDKGNKWFIPSFLEFQYPSGLNSDNRAHNSVIILLEKYNLRISKNKPLISPSEGSMDMDMVKDMDKDKDMVKAEKKVKFKENILLTQKEHLQLVAEFGENYVIDFYEYLSAYKIEKSYKTKSDYLTIKRWVVDAILKQNKTASPKIGNKYQNELETARNAFKPI